MTDVQGHQFLGEAGLEGGGGAAEGFACMAEGFQVADVGDEDLVGVVGITEGGVDEG